MTKIKHYNLIHRPVVQRQLTLTDMPENVPCIVTRDNEWMVRVRQGQLVYTLNAAGKAEKYLSSSPFRYPVVQRLDGEPLPMPPLPPTLGDPEVEEGRLYRVRWNGSNLANPSTFYRCRIGLQSYGPNGIGLSVHDTPKKSYKIVGVTDLVYEAVEYETYE